MLLATEFYMYTRIFGRRHGMLPRNSFLFAEPSPQTEGIFNGGLYGLHDPGGVMGVCYIGELSSKVNASDRPAFSFWRLHRIHPLELRGE